MKKKISPRPLIRAGLALALGLNLLSVSVPQLLGSGIYENQKIVLQKDGITVAPTGTVVFADTFETNTAWDPEKVNNYQDLLKITFGSEFQGQKCLMISGREIDRKIDTAWSVSSRPVKVPAGASEFVLSFQIYAEMQLKGNGNAGEMWLSLIRWHDTDGKECGRTVIPFGASRGNFQEISIRDAVPEGAVSAVIQLGFDYPNVDDGKLCAVRNVMFSMLKDDGTNEFFTHGGSFISDIFETGRVAWKADLPEGTALKFQISTANVPGNAENSNAETPNAEYSEITWTPYAGPDGTPESFWTEPFTVDAKYFRVKAFLVPNGPQTPILKELSLTPADSAKPKIIQNAQNWTLRGDAFDPRVKIVSESPTTDAKTELVIEITDDSPVFMEGVQVSVDEQDVTSVIRREGNRLILPPETEWAEGLHRVEVKAADFFGNTVHAKKCFFIGETPQTPKVTLRDDGMTLIDGEPFFPIGIYGVMKREFNGFDLDRAFSGLKDAGFNFAHSYNMPRTDEFLETAHKYGFRLWIPAYSIDERFINVERHHPAILAWYLGDDTSAHTTVSELFDRDDSVKALDPTRISTQADPVGSAQEISNYRDYVLGTDNFLPEIYPVRTTQPESAENCVAITIRDMKCCWEDIRRSGSQTPRSVWPIIQYFKGWGWQRFPTFDELNAMSFASIIHGANGITWYTYGGTVEPEKKKFNYGITTTPETWKNISTVATRIRELSPVLLERTPEQPAAPEILSGPKKDPLGNDSVSCLLKIRGGCAWLLCVNSSPEPVQARFSLPANLKDCAEVVFEDRTVTLDGNTLTEDFAGFAVHIYRIELKSKTN